MADEKPRSSTAFVVIAIVAVVAAIVGLLWWCGCLSGGKSATRSGERVATILAVNDIYRIDGVGEKQVGGLHRLRMLRKTIEEKSGKVLLLHAGDFLSPSLESRVFRGEQMIDAMNNLDGDPKKFDARMFVAFGNHEFDDSDCNKSPAPLMARLDESQFTWLNANLDFSSCPSMKDVPAHKNVKRTAVVELNGIKFGIFGIGLTPDPKDARRHPKFGDIYEAARAAIKELRTKKVDLIVALTHLNEKDDEMLIRSLADYGLDLLIGGHEHKAATIKDVSGTIRGYKADSDAKSAWIIKVTMPAKGGRATFAHDPKPMRLDGTKPETMPDQAVEKLAARWAEQAEAKLCAERKKVGRKPYDAKCLQEPAGTATFAIKLEEDDNRETETEFGQWIAGVVRKAMGADVAIVNSGILGLGTNLDAGAKLRFEQIVDIFRYDNDVIAMREVPAKDVCAAIRHGFGRPGSGAWPHVSGLMADGSASDTKAIQKKWWTEIKRVDGSPFDCKSDGKVKVASVPYLLCGGDEYPPMVADSEKGDKCVDALNRNPKDPLVPEGRRISQMAEEAIKAAGNQLVMPP